MNAVKTNELKVGDWAAHMMDTPNCGGIQVHQQGEIVSVEHTDMWGTLSDSLTTVVLRERGAAAWDTKMSTVNNSHTWLVRTLGR
jgi:hypothetical protein